MPSNRVLRCRPKPAFGICRSDSLLVVIPGRDGKATENSSPFTVYLHQVFGSVALRHRRSCPVTTVTANANVHSNEKIRFINYSPSLFIRAISTSPSSAG
jgi:gamma-glutamyl-gamma-aminobutyrate hydrolase PuuD